MRRAVGAAIVGAGMILCGGLVAGRAAGPLFIRFSDPAFKPHAYEFHYDGRPYTGIVYERHGGAGLGRLAFLWSGQKVWKEFYWYPDGSLWIENDYDFSGHAQGDWRSWHPDGKPKSFAHYVDGLLEGEQWSWHRNGTLVEYNVHHLGKTVTHKSWIFDGTPYYNYVYQDGHAVGVKGGDFCRPVR